MLNAFGKPIPFFWFRTSCINRLNTELGKSIKEIHELIGELGYYLIGLHAAAALIHHCIQKDDTLTRMLPEKRK